MKKNFIIKFLKKNNLTLSVCESITGGKLSNCFIQKKNSSKFFYGGFIVYQNEAKIKILDLKNNILKKNGVISKEFSKIMALRTKTLLKTNIVISLTGNAGPKCLENKPKGLVYVAILFNKELYLKKFQFCSLFSRKKIIHLTIKKTINFFYKILKKK